jgi:hypothetical protein
MFELVHRDDRRRKKIKIIISLEHYCLNEAKRNKTMTTTNITTTDVFGTKKGVVPKPVVSQKKNANPYVNKYIRHLQKIENDMKKEPKEPYNSPYNSLMDKYLNKIE